MVNKSKSKNRSIGNLPRFDLARKDPQVGTLVVANADERAELQALANDCREFAMSLVGQPDTPIQVSQHAVSSSYLDRLAELYSRCMGVYLVGDSFWATESFVPEFWESLDEAERDATYVFTAILIAQGRLQLCQPSFDSELVQQRSTAPSNSGATASQRYTH